MLPLKLMKMVKDSKNLLGIGQNVYYAIVNDRRGLENQDELGIKCPYHVSFWGQSTHF